MTIYQKMNAIKQNYPVVIALFVQVFVLFLMRNFLVLFQINFSTEFFLLSQMLVCFFLYYFIFKLPSWFNYLAFLIPLFFYIAFTQVAINSSIYGIIFIILFFTFSHTLYERVPLYLSNKKTIDELKKTIESFMNEEVSFIDLGSGTGRVVRGISSKKIKAHGAETALFIYFYSALLSKFFGGKIIRQSIWDIDLSKYNCVYTFLSPAVMDKIHLKFKDEMRPGSFLISNSFPILNLKPYQILSLNDQRKTVFYIYKR